MPPGGITDCGRMVLGPVEENPYPTPERAGAEDIKSAMAGPHEIAGGVKAASASCSCGHDGANCGERHTVGMLEGAPLEVADSGSAWELKLLLLGTASAALLFSGM